MHPGIIILTKVKRWSVISTSTRPQTKIKAKSDLGDLSFLVEWLADRSEKISVDAYNAKEPQRLYRAMWTYTKHLEKEMGETLTLWKQVVTDEDWEKMNLAGEAEERDPPK